MFQVERDGQLEKVYCQQGEETEQELITVAGEKRFEKGKKSPQSGFASGELFRYIRFGGHDSVSAESFQGPTDAFRSKKKEITKDMIT